MSEQLLNSVHDFLNRNKDPIEFANEFMLRWKEERDDGRLILDNHATSEILSSVFCLSDLFNPAADRKEYELDVQGLHAAIMLLLERKNMKSATSEFIIARHSAGATIVESIKALMVEYGISLTDAKTLVSGHPIWASVVCARAPLHDELYRLKP